MTIAVEIKHDVIKQINFKIEKIVQISQGYMRLTFENRLITPCWSLNLESLRETVKNYDHMLYRIIDIQKANANSLFSFIDHSAIIVCICDIMLILSSGIKLHDAQDAECNA